jgi:signal peptidase I
MQASDSTASTSDIRPRRPARPWRAAILSLLVPGAGHLYAWRPALAVAAWVGSVVAGAALIAALVAAPGRVAFAALLGVFVVLYIAIAAHAWKIAESTGGPARPPAGLLALLIVAFIVAAAAGAVAAKPWVDHHVARAYGVSSPSMDPGLLVGDWILASPRRGSLEHDRVVIYRRAGEWYIKRAVGVAGDTLEMRERRMYRNGQAVPEPHAVYDHSRVSASADTWGPLPVPAGKVFVLGDNRNQSNDSRYFGLVDLDSVIAYPARIYFSRDPRTEAIRWSRIGRGIR